MNVIKSTNKYNTNKIGARSLAYLRGDAELLLEKPHNFILGKNNASSMLVALRKLGYKQKPKYALYKYLIDNGKLNIFKEIAYSTFKKVPWYEILLTLEDYNLENKNI